MSKKCRSYSKSKLAFAPADNRTAFYAGWDAALRERLAQPEQEPVAWMHNYIENNVITHRPADLDRHPDRWEALYKTPPPCPTCEALARTVMMDQTSHDMAPRQWQGLTDDEKRSMVEWAHPDIIDAIELKLRERNT